MKFSHLIIIFFSLFAFEASAQGLDKFYSTEDSINYIHYQLIIWEGQQIVMKDGEPQLIIADSSYMQPNDYISIDSAKKLMREIPKFSYDKRRSNEEYASASDLENNQKPDTITHLSFQGKNIKRLPVLKLLKCKNLKEIELVNTSVKKIPWLLNMSVFGLDSLKTLRIYNHNTGKALKFSKNSNVTELVYRDSPYSPAPIDFYKLENLEEIDFAQNDFGPNEKFTLHKLRNLKHINISRNSIDINKLADDTVQNVESLILSFNHLKAVPASIGYFKDLKDLQLAENDIRSELLDPALGSLEKLEILSFYKNELDSLPPFLFNLKGLVELDLYYNSIEILPAEIGDLKNLERLYCNLSSLKEFYIHHNRVSHLPPSIGKLQHITDFHIQNNYFQGFPNFVLNYKKLEDLDVSNNEIENLPPEILNLEHLQYLWMKGITFVAKNKDEANGLKQTLETLQQKGVKVSIDL